MSNLAQTFRFSTQKAINCLLPVPQSLCPKPQRHRWRKTSRAALLSRRWKSQIHLAPANVNKFCYQILISHLKCNFLFLCYLAAAGSVKPAELLGLGWIVVAGVLLNVLKLKELDVRVQKYVSKRV